MTRIKVSKIELKERINEERLKECIRCSNFPIKSCDKSEDLITKKKAVKNYLKIKSDSEGYRTIVYTQKTGSLNMGRFCTSNGIALFPKEIKKYIAGEIYKDYDIVNCHPTILKQLFTQNNIPVCVFLNDYIEDRENAIKKYELTNKEGIFTILYDSNKKISNQYVLEFHKTIYNNYFNIAAKTLRGKKLLKFCESKNSSNFKGSFIAYMLQDYERQIIDVCFSYCRARNIKYDVSCYDGFMVDKKYDINMNELSVCVKNETGFDVDFTCKKMSTDWKPIQSEIEIDDDYEIDEPSVFSIDYVRSLKDDDSIIEYMNKHICLFTNPLTMGFRLNTNGKYDTYSKNDMDLLLGDSNIFKLWSNNSNRLVYNKQDFIIDEGQLKTGVYNRYIRPKMTPCDNVETKCAIIFYLIRNIICGGDTVLYNYILDYISFIVKYGKTGIALVITGGKGYGKSTIASLIKKLVGTEYEHTVNNINSLLSETNGHLKDKILITLEELSYNAGEFHKVHNIMKDKITNEWQNIRELYKNAYMARDQCNYIYISNFDYVVPITEDNRRFVVLKASAERKGDSDFFNDFYKCLHENIKELRHFFYNREMFNKDLRKSRPITAQERILAERTKTTVERWLSDYSESYEEELNNILKAEAYDLYEEYCKVNKEKVLPPLYFRDEMIRCNYTLKEVRKNNKRLKKFVLN